jgi:hypothetical protein
VEEGYGRAAPDGGGAVPRTRTQPLVFEGAGRCYAPVHLRLFALVDGTAALRPSAAASHGTVPLPAHAGWLVAALLAAQARLRGRGRDGAARGVREARHARGGRGAGDAIATGMLRPPPPLAPPAAAQAVGRSAAAVAAKPTGVQAAAMRNYEHGNDAAPLPRCSCHQERAQPLVERSHLVASVCWRNASSRNTARAFIGLSRGRNNPIMFRRHTHDMARQHLRLSQGTCKMDVIVATYGLHMGSL